MFMQNDDALADTSVCASTSGSDVHLLRHEFTTVKPQIQKEGGNQNLQSHAEVSFYFIWSTQNSFSVVRPTHQYMILVLYAWYSLVAQTMCAMKESSRHLVRKPFARGDAQWCLARFFLHFQNRINVARAANARHGWRGGVLCGRFAANKCSRHKRQKIFISRDEIGNWEINVVRKIRR